MLIPEILLVIDTLLKFITGYYENGLVITSKSHIISHYLKKGLIFDLLSYCPVIMQSILMDNYAIRFLQLFMFLKLKRMKIIVSNFQEMISLNGQNDYILSLLRILLQIVFFSHLTACIWHSVAYYPANENNWLEATGIKDLDWSSRYFYSMFWSVSVLVTVGSGGKITPQNDLEMIIATVILLISALFFCYTINYIKDIFDMMSKKEKEYKFLLFFTDNIKIFYLYI